MVKNLSLAACHFVCGHIRYPDANLTRYVSVIAKSLQYSAWKDIILCELVYCSEQERTDVLNRLNSVILSKYTHVTNQC